MRQPLRLGDDDRSFGVNTVEWLFMIVILVIGLISGRAAVRQALPSELIETAQAIMALNQSDSFSDQSNGESSTGGSSAIDATDTIHSLSAAAPVAIVDDNPAD